MSSYISNSDPWRRFARRFLITLGSLLAVLYGFVIIVDPWDTLPAAPKLPRVPISTNARYSFPALARSPAFDSAVFGNSSARLLQPALLNPGFGAHFANLSMNSATAYEQSRMLQVFLRAHPQPRAVIIALDAVYCTDTFERYTGRSFPEWMYEPNLWPAYRQMLTPYAIQEAWNQFAVMVHLKRRRYGLDGYTSFVPPESQYDHARRDAAFLRWPPIGREPPPPGATAEFPALPILRDMLASVPAETRKVLFFVPYNHERQGEPGSATAWRWEQCKRAVTAIAEQGGAELLDFMIPSAITSTRENYWDPVHYRIPIATRLAEALVKGESPDAVRLR
ncbi:MAG TPA: hypothetical protein VE650_00365 [Acetobacteraceae bacterium]|nr:hypothetical protein [Acetobacteraceae bacterium]